MPLELDQRGGVAKISIMLPKEPGLAADKDLKLKDPQNVSWPTCWPTCWLGRIVQTHTVLSRAKQAGVALSLPQISMSHHHNWKAKLEGKPEGGGD